MAVSSSKSQVTVRPRFERILLFVVRSRLRIATVAILFGLSTFALEHVVHLTLTRTHAQGSIFADAVILGCLGALLALILLLAAQDRHNRVQDDLRRIAELNHQVRNALQVIVYGEYSPHNADHRAAVLDGVERIEATLREMFPFVGERKDDRPWEAHNRAHLLSQNLDIHLSERRSRH
jgi:hypothetical protein